MDDKELKGDLIITGKDKIVIPLPGHKHPENFHVHFDDKRVQPPCNPHHCDSIEAEVKELKQHHHHSHRYELEIRWHVSSIRAVRWTVVYDR